jgi:hypothetical protein
VEHAGREGDDASVLGPRSWLAASTTDGTLVVARANPEQHEGARRHRIAPSAVWAQPATITGTTTIIKDVDKDDLLELLSTAAETR